MQQKIWWYLVLVLLTLTACTGNSSNNQSGNSAQNTQSSNTSVQAEDFLPEQPNPEQDCPSDFRAGQYVYPTQQVSLYYIDGSFSNQAMTTLYSDEPIYLLAHTGCYNSIPVWEAEDVWTGLRGTLLEEAYGETQIELSTDHDADRTPRTMLQIAGYCRMNVGGSSHAGVNERGEWWCGGSQGVGLFEPVNMNDACRYIYGTRPISAGRAQIFRMFSYQTDSSNENSWVCLAQPAPIVVDGIIAGDLAPFSERYVFVPSPVRPRSIEVHVEANSNSAVFGTLENLNYYELFALNREWTAIRTPFGGVGWVNSPLVVVGNNVGTNNINIQQLLNNPDTAINVYSNDALPNRYGEARSYMIDELGRDTGNVISLAWFGIEAGSGRANGLDMLCTVIDITADYNDVTAEDGFNVACIAISLGQGAFTLVRGGTPIGAYITLSEVALDNLGPFIRYNDRLWMDRMNRQAGSCFLTTLFFGEDNACRR